MDLFIQKAIENYGLDLSRNKRGIQEIYSAHAKGQTVQEALKDLEEKHGLIKLDS